MYLNHYYWHFEKALSKKDVDKILNYGKNLKLKFGQIGEFEADKIVKNNYDIKNQRNSKIVFVNDSWIYDLILPFVHTANENAGWNFQWDWSEDFQFTRYTKGEYYSWHNDSWRDPIVSDNKYFNGKARKLSVVVSLNDSNEYEGGDFEFDFRNYENFDDEKDRQSRKIKCKEIKKVGSVIVFPSFVWHRVTPVTEGTRYSLVGWNLGHPFK